MDNRTYENNNEDSEFCKRENRGRPVLFETKGLHRFHRALSAFLLSRRRELRGSRAAPAPAKKSGLKHVPKGT